MMMFIIQCFKFQRSVNRNNKRPVSHDKQTSKAFLGEIEEDLNEGKYHIHGEILSEIFQLLFDLWNQCKANCNPNFLAAK